MTQIESAGSALADYDDAVEATLQFARRECFPLAAESETMRRTPFSKQLYRFPGAAVVAFGTSMGGLLALRVALRGTADGVIASAPMLALPVGPVVSTAIKGIGWLAPTVSVTIDADARAPRHGVCTLSWLKEAQLACEELQRAVGPIEPPTTLLIGSRDPIVTVSDLRELGDRLGCDAIHVYPDSGHEPFTVDRYGKPDQNRDRYLDDIQSSLVGLLERRGCFVADDWAAEEGSYLVR